MATQTTDQSVTHERRQVIDVAGAAETRPEPASRVVQKASPWRKFWIGFFVALGVVLAFAANYAIFQERILLSTDDYVSAVRPLPQNDAVATAIATFTVDDAFAAFDAEQEIQSQLPSDLSFAAAPLASGLESFATDTIRDLIETPDFEVIWAEANRLAHGEALAILRGDSVEPFVISEGKVTLDLSGVVATIGDEINSAGLGSIDLGNDAGQLVLFEDDQLALAQEAVSLLDAVSWLLPIAALAAFGAALWISRQRRRTVVTIGAWIVVAMAFSLILMDVARGAVLDRIDDEVAKAGVKGVWDVLHTGLVVQTLLVLVLGLVVVGAAMLFGPGDRAKAVRLALTRQLSHEGGASPAAEWLTNNKTRVQVGIAAFVIAVLLIWPELSFPVLLTLVLLAGMTAVGVELAAASAASTAVEVDQARATPVPVEPTAVGELEGGRPSSERTPADTNAG